MGMPPYRFPHTKNGKKKLRRKDGAEGRVFGIKCKVYSKPKIKKNTVLVVHPL